MEKTVLTAQELLEDSFRLGVRVLEDGFEPTLIIAIWRGGTPVGMALQEILSYCGVSSDHIAIRTSSYVGVDMQGAVAVHGLNYIIKKICYDDRVLIWLVFPHELDALSEQEMQACRPALHEIVYAGKGG
jgi:hypoxanthine phosphoribosyltransferase